MRAASLTMPPVSYTHLDVYKRQNQTNGMTGYVMTAYIQLHNLPSTPWRTVSHPSGSYVNLRSSANMSINNVLSRMPSGASVQVLIPGSEWTKVSYGGTTGYMLTYFLK